MPFICTPADMRWSDWDDAELDLLRLAAMGYEKDRSVYPAFKKIARTARKVLAQGPQFAHPDLRWTDAIRFRAAYTCAKRKYKE